MSQYNDFRSDDVLIPPYSVEAEQSVLGALMMDSSRIGEAVVMLEPQDFFRNEHRVVFHALKALNETGGVVDYVTISEWLESHGKLDEAGGIGALIDLQSGTPSVASLPDYIAIVRDKSARRQFMDAATKILNEAAGAAAIPVPDLVASAMGKIATIASAQPIGAREPMNLFGVANPPQCRPEWLPPQIASYAFDAAVQMGTGADVLVLSSLVTCAAALHDDFQLQPKATEPGWKESARLWGLVVGDPSVKKTTPMRKALATLNRLNSEMEAKYAGVRAAYDRDMKVHAKIEQAAIKQEASGSGLAERIEAPQRPVHNRLIINDPTLEAMGELLADNPRGMLFYRDELAGWFDSMGAYSKNGSSGRDRSAWIEAYGGGTYIIDRIGRGTTMVPNWSCSVLGTIQPDRIRALASRMEDDGLLQRFIVAYVPPGERRESEEVHDDKNFKAYLATVEQIYSLQPPQGTFVTMSPEADQVRREITDTVGKLISSDAFPAMLRSHIGKWLGLFPRLCLTYHAIGCAATGKYPTSVPVTGTTARRVQAFITGWLLPQATYFYSSIIANGSPATIIGRSLADGILSNGSMFITRRDAVRLTGRFKDAKEWEQDASISMLVDAGWLIPEKSGGGAGSGTGYKSKPNGWSVNPLVHRMFAERALNERARRDAVRASLDAMRSLSRDEP